MNDNGSEKSRRSFLKEVAVYSGGLAVAGYATNFGGMLVPAARAQAAAAGASPAVWSKQVGLELFTVRDRMMDPKSYEAVLEKLSEIGYREIEPANGYANMDAKSFRAMLDKYNLSMPSTHSGATEGTDAQGRTLEQQLSDFAIMGIKYTEISAPRGAGGGRGAAGAGRGRGAAAGANA